MNKVRMTLEESSQMIILKEWNPWLTPTESCESDETENEEVKPFKAPPGLPDILIEETRLREPMLECQTGVTAKVVSHLHPRYTQMKDKRVFGWIMK